MNLTIYTGTLSRDPVLSKTKHGKDRCYANMAVRDAYGNTAFVSVGLYENHARNLVKYKKKGDWITVTCYTKSYSIENENGKSYGQEMIVSNLEFLSASNSNDVASSSEEEEFDAFVKRSKSADVPEYVASLPQSNHEIE